jgi:hypothetical protein
MIVALGAGLGPTVTALSEAPCYESYGLVLPGK